MFYQHIVVPLDGSAFAEAVLPYALSIAERGNGRVELVTVHEAEPSSGFVAFGEAELTAWRQRAEQGAREYLASVLERLGARGGENVSTHHLAGKPIDALEQYMAESRAGLVVMATHGHGAFSRAWLGSVADALVRRSRAPVLLIRPQESVDNVDLLAAPAFRHILVPLDGSPRAEEVLEYAVPLGMLAGAKYTLLRALPPATTISPPVLSDVLAAEPPPPEPQTLHSIAEGASRELETVAGRLRERDLEVETVTVHFGAAAAIIAEAETRHVDLIAMSTRGRGGLQRLLLGSVADKVIRGAHCPILVHAER
jgi:nucleotide-binding universal stress UspA family protein